MKFEINIDESRIASLVEEKIAEDIFAERGREAREARYGVRTGVDKAVKEYIYKNKDRIIEKVVDRASVEMVKKGMLRFLENVGKEVNDD